MSGVAPLLVVDEVSVSYRTGRAWQRTVEAVSFSLAPGETFGLAGESGSGKSTLVYQALGYRPDNARLDGGRIYWLERRPAEGGRSVVVRRDRDGRIADAIPRQANARNAVYEYGGGSYAVAGGDVFYTDFTDGRVWVAPADGGAARPVTAPGPACICVSALEKPLRFPGWLARKLQPVFGV